MFDLWAPENSTLREKALEHIFLSELSKVLLIELRTPFEVLRSEFDANGYDVVIEAYGVIRHVQLKAMRIGGKRRDIDVNLALAEKPSGCVVWFMADPATLSIGPFLWLGGLPGRPLPAIEGRPTRHSRANAAGLKAERKALRNVPIRDFERIGSIRDLTEAMFVRDETHLLRQHLTHRGISLDEVRVPDEPSWAACAELAMLVDGYELAARANLGDPFEYQARRQREAVAADRWSGSALELWVTLFLEYRRDRFDGAIGTDISSDTPPILDDLCRLLAASIRTLQQRQG